ncbi:MAG: 2Fe-2S iron-sulfur cluster binding domain-containing protein [Streptosporangiales bacterium]|nr:2Fe-2S iron-sulfur cluster binding domain-containing protein [Streptosporangiales bacterium]
MRSITLTINGRQLSRDVETRLTLADFLRDHLDLTGVHLGCEHGVCGCCTVLLDGRSVRSCLMFAVQADGHEIETVEGLSTDIDKLHPIQEAFSEEHALQCGFCTPAMILRTKELITNDGELSREEIREQLSGILCRCTGYQNIVNAVVSAREKMHDPQVAGR